MLVNPPLLEDNSHHPLFPPLGLTYLAAVLKQDEHEIKRIVAYLKEESGSKWITAVKIASLSGSLNIRETNLVEIDDSLDNYVKNGSDKWHQYVSQVISEHLKS